MSETTIDPINAARKFRRGRAAAGQRSLGPDHGLVERWYPRLAGKWVRNADDPQEGFATALEAVEAAKRYRASCEVYLQEHAA